MKLTKYLKDRAASIAMYAGACIFIVIFLCAFRISSEPVIITATIIALAVISSELWGFLRKKNYYDKLVYCLEELDQKYLICDMVERPNFYDGKILYYALCMANKSMCEQVAQYRRETSEFQEYIELWVHEVKLPLAGMQLMCRNKNTDKYTEQIRRIDDYVENVLYYARCRNAEKDYIINEVSLQRVFTETALKNRELLLQKDVSLVTMHLDVKVMSDSKWLSYILGQFMANSLKYFSSERKGEINVYAEEFADKTVLHFRDNGIGIPEKDLPYIFEKSFTGENGRIGAKSTGMGLYIVKNLCDKLGHGITVKSEKGIYTEIILTFGKNDYYRIS